jgi:hypothetical protein
MDNIELFMDARQHLVEAIEPMIEIYLCGIWDPHCKFVLIKETNEIINKELKIKFPNLPDKYLPNVKFRLFDDSKITEVNIQNFFNTDPFLAFLGSVGLGDEPFDLYYRESFDPNSRYAFVAKYGHGFEEYYSGTKTAEAEYYMGMPTPLSIAYGMALEDGVI